VLSREAEELLGLVGVRVMDLGDQLHSRAPLRQA